MGIIIEREEVVKKGTDFTEEIKNWLIKNGFVRTTDYFEQPSYNHKTLPITIQPHQVNCPFNGKFTIHLSNILFGGEHGEIGQSIMTDDLTTDREEFFEKLNLDYYEATCLVEEFLEKIEQGELE